MSKKDITEQLGISQGMNISSEINAERLRAGMEQAKKIKPLLIEYFKHNAEMKRAEYESWIEAGFTEAQALQMIAKK